MDINGWLTIITVLTAIFAFMSKEEMFLLTQKTILAEKATLFIVLLFILPFLILFDDISTRFAFLKWFTVSWGISSKSLAFVLFFFVLLWIIGRLFFFKPKGKVNSKVIEYYRNLLYEKPFEEFFGIFNKHNQPDDINADWEDSKNIIYEPLFISGLLKNRGHYILNYWEHLYFDNKFVSVFNSFLQDFNSILHVELKQKPTSKNIKNFAFLDTILRVHGKASMKQRIIPVIGDYCKNLLDSDLRGALERPYYLTSISPDGADIPLVNQLRFVELLYNVIEEYDIGLISMDYDFFYMVVMAMEINLNIKAVHENNDKSKFLFIVEEIFKIHSNLLLNTNRNGFRMGNSLNLLITQSYFLCIRSLYLISLSKPFLKRDILRSVSYNLFRIIFNSELDEKLRTFVITIILLRLQYSEIKEILIEALNESFGIHIIRFVNNTIKEERNYPALKHLYKILKDSGTIGRLEKDINVATDFD